MHNVFLVIKHEITSMLGKRSFWIMTFLFPILILGLNIGVQVMSRRVKLTPVRKLWIAWNTARRERRRHRRYRKQPAHA